MDNKYSTFFYSIFNDDTPQSAKDKLASFIITLAFVVGSAVIITFCYNWLFPIVYPLTLYKTLCIVMFIKMLTFIILTGTPFVQQSIMNLSGFNEYYYSRKAKNKEAENNFTITTMFQITRGALFVLYGLVLLILYLFD